MVAYPNTQQSFLSANDVLLTSSVTIKVTSPGFNLQTCGESSPQSLHSPTREPVRVSLRILACSAHWWYLSESCGHGLSLNPKLLVDLGSHFIPQPQLIHLETEDIAIYRTVTTSWNNTPMAQSKHSVWEGSCNITYVWLCTYKCLIIP